MRRDVERAWQPLRFGDEDRAGLAAVKAVFAGTARPDQQIAAMAFIADRISGAWDLSYRPDEHGGERDTCFSEGRRFVGLQLRKIEALPMERLAGPTKGEV